MLSTQVSDSVGFMQDSDDLEKIKSFSKNGFCSYCVWFTDPFIWCSVIAKVIECLPQIKNFHTDISVFMWVLRCLTKEAHKMKLYVVRNLDITGIIQGYGNNKHAINNRDWSASRHTTWQMMLIAGIFCYNKQLAALWPGLIQKRLFTWKNHFFQRVFHFLD